MFIFVLVKYELKINASQPYNEPRYIRTEMTWLSTMAKLNLFDQHYFHLSQLPHNVDWVNVNILLYDVACLLQTTNVGSLG